MCCGLEMAERVPPYACSDLRATIAKAYRVEGEPRVEVMKGMMPLRG